ncbi:hypothetical protein K3495_g11755 [Podosphaera aphanis]|nr:hypothetical protein K3495_g11755 [Podosphaera aphanis]
MATGDVTAYLQNTVSDSEAGAIGPDGGLTALGKESVIAVIIVSICICTFGIYSGVVFYMDKKRSRRLPKDVKKSAQRVTMASSDINDIETGTKAIKELPRLSSEELSHYYMVDYQEKPPPLSRSM